MTTKTSYFIRYGENRSAWLSPNKSPTEFDNVTYTEERIMLYADEGKVLQKNNEIIGQCIWLKDDDSIDNYVEVDDIPYSEEPEPEAK